MQGLLWGDGLPEWQLVVLRMGVNDELLLLLLLLLPLSLSGNADKLPRV